MPDERNDLLLATAIATGRDRRQAFVVMAVLVLAFVLTAPIAGRRVAAVPQFVPIYDTAIFVLDMLTAVLLYAQFEHYQRRSVLVLACAFFFTPIVAAGHALSIPDAFVGGTVIGGPQTAAWLWVAWHAVFPLFIAVYAVVAHTESAAATGSETAPRRTGIIAVAAAAAFSLAAVAIIAAGDRSMPPLMHGDTQSSRLTTVVLGTTWVLHTAALAVLAWYTRLRRMIDLWLAVTLVALSTDVLLSGAMIVSRYQLGFYLGRVYGLVATLLVLGMLLRQTVALSAMAARAAAAATSAGRAKDEFLAMAGHELRNPLAPIANTLALMRAKGSDSSELRVLERQVGHLRRLVDDLLDVSRVGAGKLALDTVRVEIAEPVRDAIDATAGAFEQKQQRLEVSIPETGLPVQADPQRLAQVFANLLNNASKYSDSHTRVRVHAQQAGDRVIVAVEDEGLGIVPEMLDRIFDPFTQQSRTLARSRGGLGLGLTIVRNLVDAHGGSVRVRSSGAGQGSEFIVELPLAGPLAA